MITYVKGILTELTPDGIVVETAGFGMHIFMPESMVQQLPLTGTEVRIYTYLNVREDAMQLFGFLSRDDLNMFRQMIAVNGIGPKAAMGILAAIPADELRYAILSEDVRTISKAPGIGNKTAQKMILELKDKISLADTFAHDSGKRENQGDISDGQAGTGSRNEAVLALAALGYSNAEALRAVSQVEEAGTMETDDLLKAALKHLAM